MMVVLKLLSVPIISMWTMGQSGWHPDRSPIPRYPRSRRRGACLKPVPCQVPTHGSTDTRPWLNNWPLAGKPGWMKIQPHLRSKPGRIWHIEKFTGFGHGFETHLPLNPWDPVLVVSNLLIVWRPYPHRFIKPRPKAHLSGKASEHRAYSGSFHDSHVGYINLPQQVYTSRFDTLTISQYSSSTICLPKKRVRDWNLWLDINEYDDD